MAHDGLQIQIYIQHSIKPQSIHTKKAFSLHLVRIKWPYVYFVKTVEMALLTSSRSLFRKLTSMTEEVWARTDVRQAISKRMTSSWQAEHVAGI